MKSTISAIFSGSLKPPSGTIPNDKEYQNITSKIAEILQSLNNSLTTEQKKALEDLIDEQQKLSYQNELSAFKAGFSLATQLIIEAINTEV